MDAEGKIYLSTTSPTSDDLLHIFDEKGVYVGSFVRRIVKNPIASMSNYMVFSISDDNDCIFVSFVYWPIVRKYTMKGKLLFERRLNLKSLSNELKRYLLENPPPRHFERIKRERDAAGSLVVRAIYAIYALRGRCYLLSARRILCLDSEGNVDKIYDVSSVDSLDLVCRGAGNFIIPAPFAVYFFVAGL